MTLIEELTEITVGQNIMVTLNLDNLHKVTYLVMVISNKNGAISGKFVSEKDGSIDDLYKSWAPTGAFSYNECADFTILHEDCDLGI